MFATLLGPLPRPPLRHDATPTAILEAVVAVQVEHGLDPLTDGGWPLVPDDPVAAWQATSALTDRLVKAVVPGPITGGGSAADVRSRILALAEAGCTWIEVQEPAAVSLEDDAARQAFAEVHRTLTADLPSSLHLSLAITGGSADGAGIDTILAGTYASLAVDLIDGPDNWRLVAAAPPTMGVVCGALSTRAGSDDGPELLLWAAGYAASTGGRGPARVGLATAGSLADLSWDAAATKLARLGAAARLADTPREQRRAAVDPRSLDLRSAALGKPSPRPNRATRRAARRRPG